MTSLNESIVEDAALEWFGELGYAVGHGPLLRQVNRRRSGIRLARQGDCAKLTGG